MTVDVKNPPAGSGLLRAIGDGIQDDRAAIQGAADFLTQLGGGRLYFPAGAYRCRRAPGVPASPNFGVNVGIDISQNYSVKITGSNLTLEGEGAASVILQDEVHVTPIYFEFPDGNDTGNILVRNLKFKGNTSPDLVLVWSYGYSGVPASGALLGLVGRLTKFPRNISIVDCIFEDANKSTAILPRYIDNLLIQGCSFIHFKDYVHLIAVKAATSTADSAVILQKPSATGRATIDGVPCVEGDVVLLRNQDPESDNGVYVVKSGGLFPWTRAPLADSDTLLASIQALVVNEEAASLNKKRVFQVVSPPPFISESAISSTTELTFKTAVRVRLATTLGGNISLSGARTVDGFTTNPGDRVLVKDQTNPAQNGLYVASAGSWSLASDASTSPSRESLLFCVSEGVSNQGLTFETLDPTLVSFRLAAVPAPPIVYTPIRSATTGPVALGPGGPGTATFDAGVTLNVDDRLLVKDQPAGSEKDNGIYLFKGSAAQLVRDTRVDLQNEKFLVLEGDANRLRFFRQAVPLPIILGTTGLVFQETNSVFTPVSAASGVTNLVTPDPTAANPLGNPPNDTIDLKALVGATILFDAKASLTAGDRVLLKNQTSSIENGIYIVPAADPKPTWLRASDLAIGSNPSRLLVHVANVGDYNAYQVFGLPRASATSVVGTSALEFFAENIPGPPSVFVGVYLVNTFRLVNNYFNGDYNNMGPVRGTDGLVWTQSGAQLVAEGNILDNFRFEGIQPHSQRSVVRGNMFRSRKVFSTVSVHFRPNTNLYTEFFAEIVGNSSDGPRFVDGALFELDASVFLDLNISDNQVKLNPGYAGGAISFHRGRRVLISGNSIEGGAKRAILVLGAGSLGAGSSLTIVGNTITGFASSPDNVSSRVIVINDDNGLHGDNPPTYNYYFTETVIARNFISSAGTHVSYGRPAGSGTPPVPTVSLSLFENVYANSRNGVALPSIDTSYGGGGGIEIKGFYGRQSSSALPPVADISRYSQGDIVWNSARKDQRSPLGYSHIGAGKLTPIFSSGMGFRASATINLSTGSGVVALLSGLRGQRFRVLRAQFILQGNPGSPTGGSLMIRSVPSNASPTSRLVASVQGDNIRVPGAGAPTIPEGPSGIQYPPFASAPPNIVMLGGLYEVGQGIEVVRSSDDMGLDPTAPLRIWAGNTTDIEVVVLGVMEYA